MTTRDAVSALCDAIVHSTTVYRKGDVVTDDTSGALRVVTINAFPERPADATVADVHFIYVALNPDADRDADRDALRVLFVAAMGNQGEFATLNRSDIEGGPSYITWGHWLGSQQLALQLLGMGELLGWWLVITPEILGVEGDAADQMAGSGFVMNGGLSPGVFEGPQPAQNERR